MYSIDDRRIQAVEALKRLMSDSKARPFLFRTRYERTMIKLQSLAREMGDEALEKNAVDSLKKMRNIVDKSNSTSDGVLRSFVILEPEIKKFMAILG